MAFFNFHFHRQGAQHIRQGRGFSTGIQGPPLAFFQFGTPNRVFSNKIFIHPGPLNSHKHLGTRLFIFIGTFTTSRPSFGKAIGPIFPHSHIHYHCIPTGKAILPIFILARGQVQMWGIFSLAIGTRRGPTEGVGPTLNVLILPDVFSFNKGNFWGVKGSPRV